MSLILIACIDEKNGIGDAQGNLLFNIPKDMKHFRETTEGGICVFGRKTAESLPDSKPLPNRRNILLTTDLNNGIDGFETETDGRRILKLSKDNDVYICGGGEVYSQFIVHADTLIITHVRAECADSTAFFPHFTHEQWSLQEMKEHKKSRYNPSFAITTYIRK